MSYRSQNTCKRLSQNFYWRLYTVNIYIFGKTCRDLHGSFVRVKFSHNSILIPQWLAGLEHMPDALLGALLTQQSQKRLALQIEQVLLGDSGSTVVAHAA